MSVGLSDHQREQLGEDRGRTVSVGIRQGRALHRASPQMVQPRLMAAYTGDDLTQARGPRQLTIEQCNELAFAGQSPHPCISPVPLNQPIEGRPWDLL